MSSTQPVGIFDSGVGGLTVVAEVLKRMPSEDVVYFGDTARVPYGIKSPGVIREFSLEIARFLVAKNVKAIVVACNTASAVALETLRNELDVPVIGVVNAGARLGIEASRSGRLAVIGTASTIDSRAYPRAVESLNSNVRTLSIACPLFVPMVEDTIFDGPVAEAAVRHYLSSLDESAVDTIILGCTHYPFLKPVIQKTLKSGISIVDAAAGTAEDLSVLLEERELLNPGLGAGGRTFYFSDRTVAFQKLARLIIPDFMDDMIQIDVESAEFRLNE
jgi:glutamate racemase